MHKISLPFLSPVVKQGGLKRPEWRNIAVDIPEVDVQNVELAMCKAERYHDKTVLHSLYFHDGNFFAGVPSVTTPRWDGRYFNEKSVWNETPIWNLTDHEFSLVTQMASARLLHETAFSVSDDMQDKFASGAQNWAKQSLFVCDDRLFKKVDPPSLTLRVVKNKAKGGGLSLVESGELGGFGEAIHFAGPNEDFKHFKMEAIADGVKPPLTSKSASGLSELRQAGREDDFVVVGGAVFNKSIQERIAQPEFFAGRSLLQIAWSICHADRHTSLHKTMTDDVDVLSEVLGYGPEAKRATPEKIEDIAERLEGFQGHITNPAQKWVIDRALERYRSLAPIAAVAPEASPASIQMP